MRHTNNRPPLQPVIARPAQRAAAIPFICEATTPLGDISGGGVNGGVNDLLAFIKANPGKKSKEIKSALNLPQRTLDRWLKELREQKKIKFQGPPKTGGYYFLDGTDPKLNT